jgi:hypothetical protein
MRLKTLHQIVRLQTGIDYLVRAANELRDAGEPGLALAILSIRQKADFARCEAVVREQQCGTRVVNAS